MRRALHVVAATMALMLTAVAGKAQTIQEPTVNGTLDVISGNGELAINQDVQWQAYIDAHDREGESANLQIKLHKPAQSENFTLYYNSNRDATTEEEAVYEEVAFENGVATVGPEEGVVLPASYKEYFKINFSEPGIYVYDLVLVRTDGNQLAKVTETVSVGTVAGTDDMIGDTRVAVYPTVSNGMVRLNLGSIRNAEVAVHDILGRKVLQLSRANGVVEINTQKYARGTYFVKVSADNDMASSRLIVR
ncbi:T9SS type A sorting domain-containing protein [Pontibacter mangrovi]|uniref:T9SS type A sorting domain-containing protein n=1 Tax=Pontibacter mangrovi TaxID=2589816 RepID=A0A501W8Y1_9BACT|nr:T9SS type A sorting domain-containing protein [Pontibacter mangrovi]TPE44985.1 T9SS type A sorting domain-containing protein [Pontibacter mangrovi]